MPQLEKTIIYPGNNPDPILEKSILKIVVLTDDLGLVKKANNLSLNPPTSVDRYVIWFKEFIANDINVKYPYFPNNLADIKAFALSTKNKVAKVIYKNESTDYVDLDAAFTKAGLPQYN